MLKHIIFDFDGTIADSIDLGLGIFNELSDQYHYQKRTLEEIRQLMSLPMKERFQKVGVPFYQIPRIAVDCINRYRDHAALIKAFDGIGDLTQRLKNDGFNLAVISTNSVENIKEILSKNLIGGLDNIISEKRLFGKDAALKKYLKHLNLTAGEVIYIGDELRDIEACKKMAVRIISAAWGLDSLELLQSGKPDYIANRPGDVYPIIRSIADCQ